MDVYLYENVNFLVSRFISACKCKLKEYEAWEKLFLQVGNAYKLLLKGNFLMILCCRIVCCLFHEVLRERDPCLDYFLYNLFTKGGPASWSSNRFL